MGKVKTHTSSTVALNNSVINKMPLPVKSPRKGKRARYNSSELWDTKVGGLFVRAGISGKKVFYQFYQTKITRIKRNYWIGEYPNITVAKARSEGQKVLGQVADGRDPHLEKRSQIHAGTLAEYRVFVTLLVRKPLQSLVRRRNGSMRSILDPAWVNLG